MGGAGEGLKGVVEDIVGLGGEGMGIRDVVRVCVVGFVRMMDNRSITSVGSVIQWYHVMLEGLEGFMESYDIGLGMLCPPHLRIGWTNGKL